MLELQRLSKIFMLFNMHLPISVFIITKNEEELISNAILSVKDFADEIIIVDSGSTDQTVSIADKLGARTLYNAWPGYVKQKIYAESLCRNKWILNIDADEELSLEFISRLREIFASGSPNKAYICQMVMVHRLEGKLKLFAPKTKAIRLYHIDYAGFVFGDLTSDCHDSVCLKNKDNSLLGFIKEPILHRSVRSIEQFLGKSNYYTSLQANELFNKSRQVSLIRLLFEPFFYFFKYYFIRRYFVFGINGFIDSMIFSFTKFIRLAKLREKYQERNVSRET